MIDLRKKVKRRHLNKYEHSGNGFIIMFEQIYHLTAVHLMFTSNMDLFVGK